MKKGIASTGCCVYFEVVDTVELNVGELTDADRSAAERLVGHSLGSGQRLQIEVLSPNSPGAPETPNGDEWPLPDWLNVYEGLT